MNSLPALELRREKIRSSVRADLASSLRDFGSVPWRDNTDDSDLHLPAEPAADARLQDIAQVEPKLEGRPGGALVAVPTPRSLPENFGSLVLREAEPL